jgi:hypothetical protein
VGGSTVISFGGFCEYYLKSMMDRHGFPFQKDLCIDIRGGNHKGFPVYFPKEILNTAIQRYMNVRKIL